MSLSLYIVAAIFVIALALMLTEKVNETATALFGMCLAGAVLVLDGKTDFPGFVASIGWDTVLFITAMMIITSLASSSGMFQYIALMLVRGTGGDPKKVFFTFMGFTFVISLFMDPLTTIIVIGPFTVAVCRALEMEFRILLLSEVMIAGYASFPSVVGSIPNLVIVFWTGISPAVLFLGMLPLSIMILFVTTYIVMRRYGKETYSTDRPIDSTVLLSIQPTAMIQSRRDFYLSCIGLALLILGFLSAPALSVNTAFIALTVASLMLMFSTQGSEELLRRISWDTIFYLIGLLGLVAAMVTAGVIEMIGDMVSTLIGENIVLAILMMVWVPGFVLSPIDAVPVGAFMAQIANRIPAGDVAALALTTGTNMNGYVIPFGDAPCMVVMSLLDAENRSISWAQFTKFVFPFGILHLVMSTIYCSFLSFILV